MNPPLRPGRRRWPKGGPPGLPLDLTSWGKAFLVPRPRNFAIVAVLAVLGVYLLWSDLRRRPAPPAGTYLLTTWNVENLFDDEDDPANPDELENWFGHNPAFVREKLGLIARALLERDGGDGPDVLVVVEVENRRAVELLRDALNAALPTDRRYEGLVHRDNINGRRIEPAVLTRLTVRDGLTRDFAPQRILEAHLEGPGGSPLVVLACHWTSRLREGSAIKRADYADTIYRRVSELTAGNPGADVVIAGDFNDDPDDPSVAEHLHATGDTKAVREALGREGPPVLLDLAAGLDPARDGTYLYRGRWQVLDHVVVTPGMLDPVGWLVLPETWRTEHDEALRAGRDGHPMRFGGANYKGERGPSDHFAVSVQLREGP